MPHTPAYQFDTAAQVMICDCCLQPFDRLWMYRHRGFCIERHGLPREHLRLDAGWWAFCVYCHAMFQVGEIHLLVARVATLVPDVDAADAARLYGLLPAVTYGDCVAWEPGNPRYFDIPARDY